MLVGNKKELGKPELESFDVESRVFFGYGPGCDFFFNKVKFFGNGFMYDSAGILTRCLMSMKKT